MSLKKVFHRSRIYPLVLILIVFLVWKYRESNKLVLVTFQGTTMGPIQYTVRYLSENGENFQTQVDSLLEEFNKSLNHYRPDSEVSRFNRDSAFTFSSPFFPEILQKSAEVYSNTHGAFDPTVAPLVNAWGFGPGERQRPDSAMVDSLLQIIYFDNLEFNLTHVWKKKNIQLDFSAIAKGQAVDVVVDLLLQKGVGNIFVDIGGEVRCVGKNEKEKPWNIGIINPLFATTSNVPYGSVLLEDKSMATSGNYYNVIDEGGRRIVHTINPSTGYPVESNLLSVSVVANDCMTADAYATAFMVVGLEESIELSKQIANLDVILIFSDNDGTLNHFVSEGLQSKFSIAETAQ